jgi:hypothetical protein
MRLFISQRSLLYGASCRLTQTQLRHLLVNSGDGAHASAVGLCVVVCQRLRAFFTMDVEEQDDSGIILRPDRWAKAIQDAMPALIPLGIVGAWFFACALCSC